MALFDSFSSELYPPNRLEAIPFFDSMHILIPPRKALLHTSLAFSSSIAVSFIIPTAILYQLLIDGA